MDRNGRVLARRGARELTPKEIELVGGAGLVHTNVACFAQATSTLTTIDIDGTVNDVDSAQ